MKLLKYEHLNTSIIYDKFMAANLKDLKDAVEIVNSIKAFSFNAKVLDNDVIEACNTTLLQIEVELDLLVASL